MGIEIVAGGGSRGTFNVWVRLGPRNAPTVASGDVGYANRHNADLMASKAIELLDVAYAAGDPRLALTSRWLGGGGIVHPSPALAAALVRLALRSVVREPQADNASWDVFGGEWDNLK